MITPRAGWGLGCALGLLALAGCGGGPVFGTVGGQVRAGGKPADKVRVEFHPDAGSGTKGPSSSAETDADGRYTLTCFHNDRAQAGAVVGKHKVVLQDMRLAASETGQGVPIRFGPEYATVLTTPLDKEVTAGEQTIDIEVTK